MIPPLEFLQKIFTVPEQGKNYQGYMVYVLTLIWAVTIAVVVTLGMFFFPEAWQRYAGYLIGTIFTAVLTLSLNYLGHSKVASWTLTLLIWVIIANPIYTTGGMEAPMIVSQVSVILTAGFLLGWRGGFAIGFLTIAFDFLFVYLENEGLLPSPTIEHTPLTRWISAFIPFGTILALQYYATTHLKFSLNRLRDEIKKRETAEKFKDETLVNLRERVKELQTLYSVSKILQDESKNYESLCQKLVEVIPTGWQYPEITVAKVQIGQSEYRSQNYQDCIHSQSFEMKTSKGSLVRIEVGYLQETQLQDEGPFLKEERELIEMLTELLKIDLERREDRAALKDYKYAIDMASSVSISKEDGTFSSINENFGKLSRYQPEELIGQHHKILWSGFHHPAHFDSLRKTMGSGEPYRGEFCNRAKDGSLYWVDTTVVPFLDENGKIYQFLSINYDITERKLADEKIKESEKTLRKITSQIPGNTYMFTLSPEGLPNIIFMSRGTDVYNQQYKLEDVQKDPDIIFDNIHPEDKKKLKDAFLKAFQSKEPISMYYRIFIQDQTRWRWFQAIPERDKNGGFIWYGATNDITPLVDYILSTEQIIFDISHVVRRPIANMKGILNLFHLESLSEEEIKNFTKVLLDIAVELDDFSQELNQAYEQRRDSQSSNWDFFITVDPRENLFPHTPSHDRNKNF